MKLFHCLGLLLVASGLLAGCISQESTAPPIRTETQFSSPTSIPTISPVSTLQPTQTMTLTPPVTLEPGQVENTVKTLLQEPVDCEAPCFWGIMPGKTTFGEAQNLFLRLGLNLRFTLAEGGKEFYGVIYDLSKGSEITPVLTVQDNIIKNLKIGINPTEQKAGTSREWSAYSPETLIERYGTPSKVNFASDWGPQSFFEMDMYFDNFDLIVHYSVYGFIEETYPQVCVVTPRN